MRISDWSSDVCSSDLQDMRLLTYQGDAVHEAAAAFSAAQQRGDAQGAAEARKKAYDATDAFAAEAVRATRAHTERMEKDPELNRNGAEFAIGRASCRDRVCRYV